MNHPFKIASLLVGLLFGCFAVFEITNGTVHVLAAGPSFTTIDFPGAVFTLAADINHTGQIVGRYADTTGINHGFLLSDGTFTSLTFPGAVWTRTIGINSGGDIVGDYSLTDVRGDKDVHGFLLHGGNYFSFDFPGAAATVAEGINTNGDIAGFYSGNTGSNTGSNNRHGFLLSGGAFTSIDFPGASSTEAWKINDHGEIAGRYQGTTNAKWHLYSLSSGVFTSFPDFSGAAQMAPDGYAHVGGLNSQGDIATCYCSSTPCQNIFNSTVIAGVHSLLLSGGFYTSIDPPAALGSFALGINDIGDIVGTYEDSGGMIHGYLRTP